MIPPVTRMRIRAALKRRLPRLSHGKLMVTNGYSVYDNNRARGELALPVGDKDGPPRNHDGRLSGDCTAVNDILSTIGDKWTVLIVVTLSKGPMRFNEIR